MTASRACASACRTSTASAANSATVDRSLQDDIVRELLNGCWQYEQERAKSATTPAIRSRCCSAAARRAKARAAPANSFGNLPFAYRTRFGVPAMRGHLPAELLQRPPSATTSLERNASFASSSARRPPKLFYHQNPGGAVEQMVSFGSQQPYTGMKSAFRYRKEFVQGCSCKQAEYDPRALEKRAEAPPPGAAPTPAQPPAAVCASAPRNSQPLRLPYRGQTPRH